MATRKRATTTPRVAAKPATQANLTERTEGAAVAINAEQAAAQSVPKATGSTNVIVCYNSPTGIIFDLPQTRGGIKKVLINGNATHLRGKERAGALPVGAFGMTVIPAEDWEAIKERYGRMRIFKSGLIFASCDRESAQKETEDRKELRNGFEPVDVDNPKRGSQSAPDKDL